MFNFPPKPSYLACTSAGNNWSEEGLLIGGIYLRMQVAHLKLCASRALWLVAYPSQGHEMLFDAHTRAFSTLGCVPRRGI